MRLYGELTKVEAQDDGTLKVFGIASSGSPDQVGETVLPEAVRAALPDYMAFAAVREMHQPSAAGTTLFAEVGEDGLTRIETHIVDPLAIRKVQAGVYKGFSLGGKTLARDPSDPSVITRIRLNEISLVDRPCNPDATIDLWKADPTADLTHEAPSLTVQPSNEAVKVEAERLARAAGRPGRRNDYLAAAREALIKRAAPPQDEPAPDAAADGAAPPRKAPPAPALAAAPAEPAPEEADDAGEDGAAALPPADSAADDGADPAAADDDRAKIQAIHDQCVALGARCDHAGDAAPTDTAAKAVHTGDLAKLAAERDRYASALTLAAPQIEALNKRLDLQAAEIALLKAQPLPPKTAGSALAVVDKVHDGGAGGVDASSEAELIKLFEALPAEQRALIAMKAALANGRPVG